jgi:hypothetical protein
MNEDDSPEAGGGPSTSITSRRDVHMGTRSFEIDIATAPDGRIRLVLICRDSTGAVRSQVDAKLAIDDLAVLVQVLGGELKSLARVAEGAAPDLRATGGGGSPGARQRVPAMVGH